MHDPSLGFIAGVMHDIGKAGLNTDLGQDPQTVSSEMGKAKGTWLKLEKDLCGIDHCSLGSHFGKAMETPKGNH